jgi:hypothetical protein
MSTLFNQLVWPRGGNVPPSIVFHEDAGHGWLQVPRHLLESLEIAEKISGYSYSDLDNGYLEEDCDLFLFIQALEAKYGLTREESIRFFNDIPKEYSERSKVRRLNHYQYKKTTTKNQFSNNQQLSFL